MLKQTSLLRRVQLPIAPTFIRKPALEGEVCGFRVYGESTFVTVEAVTGRAMEILPGEEFLAVPGFRESTRWVVGHVPDGGLVPGAPYWILSASGIVGELKGTSAREKIHLGRATYLGVLQNGLKNLSISDFALTPIDSSPTSPLQTFLIIGTSSEVGKTTAAVQLVRLLKSSGLNSVVALKATGTSAVTELHKYKDYGASQCFDCLDFGLPSTYPSGRPDAPEFFTKMIEYVCSVGAEAIVIECGGDLFGANVPEFLDVLQQTLGNLKVVLVAADTSAAIGAVSELSIRGIIPSLISGPCTDTPTIRERTQHRLGIAALNLAFGTIDSETFLEDYVSI